MADVSLSSSGKRIIVRAYRQLHNGDGLGYYDAKGEFCGFRANRIEGNTIIAATQVDIPKGTALYRNLDSSRRKLLADESATRRIEAQMTLRTVPYGLALDVSDERGCRVTVSKELAIEPARSPQAERHRHELERTGDTVYKVTELIDRASDMFIPASALSSLRRDALQLLDAAARATYHYDYRRPEGTMELDGDIMSYHDNVANRLSEKFYAEHGAKVGERALETSPPMNLSTPLRVMTTRYCLRRELGVCLRTPDGKTLQGPLTLRSGTREFTLEFDCESCRMHVMARPAMRKG